MIAPQDFVSSANIYVWGLFGWGGGREEKTKTKSKRFIGKVVVLRHPSIVSWMFWLQRLLWLWSPTREWGVSATVGADKGWGRSIRWAFFWDRFRLSLPHSRLPTAQEPCALRLERYDNSENFNWAKNMHQKIFFGPYFHHPLESGLRFFPRRKGWEEEERSVRFFPKQRLIIQGFSRISDSWRA